MDKNLFFTLVLAMLFCIPCFGQEQFMGLFGGGNAKGKSAVSYKKITYITMDDGSDLEVNLKKFKFSKGQIDELKFVTLDNKKMKVKVDKIKHMYVPASALSKLGAGLEGLSNFKNYGNSELSTDLFSKGYYYFEKAPTKVKKKSFDTMNQLLNPYTSKYIKVYPDYKAKKTMGLGIAGINVVGGLEKSYYVRVGDGVAYRVKKGMYKEQFELLFKDSPKILEKYKDGAQWKDFAKHILEYTQEMNG